MKRTKDLPLGFDMADKRLRAASHAALVVVSSDHDFAVNDVQEQRALEFSVSLLLELRARGCMVAVFPFPRGAVHGWDTAETRTVRALLRAMVATLPAAKRQEVRAKLFDCVMDGDVWDAAPKRRKAKVAK